MAKPMPKEHLDGPNSLRSPMAKAMGWPGP